MRRMAAFTTFSLLGVIPLSVLANTPPTIVSTSFAQDPVTGISATLTVEATDDGGASNLVYVWAVVGTPPGPVTFSANNSNAARTTTATVTKAGSYEFQVTVKDSGGLTTPGHLLPAATLRRKH